MGRRNIASTLMGPGPESDGDFTHDVHRGSLMR